MRNALLLAVGTTALSGCASVVLNAAPIAQTECRPLESTVSGRSLRVSSLQDAVTSRYLESLEPVAIPFRSPPPQFAAPQTVGASASAISNQVAASTLSQRLALSLPKQVMSTTQANLPPEVIDAGRELWAILYELSPSLQASEKLRASMLERAPAPSLSTTEVVALQNSAELARRLSQAIQKGGEDGLVAATFTNYLTQYNAFTALSPQATSDTRKAVGEALSEAQSSFDAAVFVQVYVKRYFRNGKVLQSKLVVNDLATRALDSLGTSIRESDKAAALEKLKQAFQRACADYGDDGCTLTSLGKESLVTRSGEVIQFKGLSFTIGSGGQLQPAFDYPKSSEFAPQLTRVVVEALFDSMPGRPPAAAASTACTEKLMVGDECLTDDVIKKREKLLQSVGELDAKASRADHLATVATSQLIRGASVIALNNEALAKSAENMAGVIARKVIERTVWQQQGQDACLNVAPAAVLQVQRR